MTCSGRGRYLGVLRYVDDDMRVVPDGAGPVYAMGGVYWRIGVLAALSVADMLAQAWWVNMSLSIGFDPWWLGVLGIDGSSFDFLGFMAGVCAVLPVVGILLVLPAFIWPRERTLFHIMMLCFWEGTSRMLGAGLGRTILYMRGVRDGVIDHFAGSGVPGPLKESDTVVGMWPAVVGGHCVCRDCFRVRRDSSQTKAGCGKAHDWHWNRGKHRLVRHSAGGMRLGAHFFCAVVGRPVYGLGGAAKRSGDCPSMRQQAGRTVLDVVFRRTHLGRDSVHIPCHHGCHLRNLTWPVKLTGAHAQRTISKRALV